MDNLIPDMCQEIFQYLEYEELENLTLVNKHYYHIITNKGWYQTYLAVKRALKQNDIMTAIEIAASTPISKQTQDEKKILDYLIGNLEETNLIGIESEELIKSLAANGKIKLAKYYGKLMGKHLHFIPNTNPKIISEEDEDEIKIAILLNIVIGCIEANGDNWKKYYDKLEVLCKNISFLPGNQIAVLSAGQIEFLKTAIESENKEAYHYISQKTDPSAEEFIYGRLYCRTKKSGDEYFIEDIENHHQITDYYKAKVAIDEEILDVLKSIMGNQAIHNFHERSALLSQSIKKGNLELTRILLDNGIDNYYYGTLALALEENPEGYFELFEEYGASRWRMNGVYYLMKSLKMVMRIRSYFRKKN